MESVLILNAGYEPLHRVSVRHAIRMLAREVAVVEEAVEDRMFGHFPFPKVLRLVRYVQLKWRHMIPSWSRMRLLERDKGRCGYCGAKASTVDHVVPRCQGGETTWMNTVAACFKCNNKKGSRTMQQSGMMFVSEPFTPTWTDVGRLSK